MFSVILSLGVSLTGGVQSAFAKNDEAKTMEKVFKAAVKIGPAGCDFYAGKEIFKDCLMYSAYHRRKPAECASVAKLPPYNVGEASEITQAACVGMIGKLTNDKTLCEKYVPAAEVRHCSDYMKDAEDFQFAFWKDGFWNLKVNRN